MLRILLKIVRNAVLMFFALCSFAQAAAIDQKTLDLPITLLSGQTVKLGQYKGDKPVYLKFWATWCQSCLKQMSHLQHSFNKYDNKVEIIAVNIGVNDDQKSVAAIQKKFGLTMPIAIDKSGELAKAFNLIGTPYHVLLDTSGNVAYAGYEETTGLDKSLKMMLAGKTLSTDKTHIEPNTATPINLSGIAEKPSAIFFVSTWCDWYLKDSHPTVSQNCIVAQKQVNKLYKQYPQVNWVGVASRLWTGAPELAEYKKKFNVKHPLAVDSTNSVTFEYGVKDYPTLVLLSNGKEVFRTQRVESKELSTELKKLTSHY